MVIASTEDRKPDASPVLNAVNTFKSKSLNVGFTGNVPWGKNWKD
jgi:hypothetical protein